MMVKIKYTQRKLPLIPYLTSTSYINKSGSITKSSPVVAIAITHLYSCQSARSNLLSIFINVL